MNMNTLMTGDLVVCNNGKMATVMKNTNIGDILRFHTEKDSFSYLNKRYNENLTHKTCSGLTISKVYRVDPDRIEANKIGDLIANPDKMLEYGSLIYSRDGASRRIPVVPALSNENKEDDKPKIEDLLTGDMLVHLNGDVSTVYKDTPFGDITRYVTEKNSFTYLYRFDNETLKHESKDDYDIIGVFRANGDDAANAGDTITNPAKMLVAKNAVWVKGAGFSVDWYRNGEHDGFVYYHNSNGSNEDSDDNYDDDLDF